MTSRYEKGLSGEQAAAKYLVEDGFEILEHRYRFGHKEIDLIVRKEDLVVFVEVKSRHCHSYVPLELSVPPRKRRNLIQAAQGYLLEKGNGGGSREYRFDVILLYPPEAGGVTRLEHIKNAFHA